MGMPRVWVTDGRITNAWWDEHGVEVDFQATLNVEHLDPIPVLGKVSGGLHTPTVEILRPSEMRLDMIPDSMGQINNWMDDAGLLEKWGEEVAIYKAAVGVIELPGIEGVGTTRKLWYNVPLNTPYGAALLLFVVEITEAGAKGYLYPLNGDGEYSEECCLSKYELEYPITMDSIKDKVRGTLRGYVDAI